MNYAKYLSAAVTAEDFHIRFNHLARNTRGWLQLGLEINELPALIHTDREEAVRMATAMLRRVYNAERPERTVKSRKISRRRHQLSKWAYEDALEDNDMYDTEDMTLMPVIHGGCLGRVHAAIYHGRGYGTENSMPNHSKKIEEKTGIMFHSDFSGRADGYAKMAASQRVGVRAVLMAMVPRKYLYNNQGDEYSLPYWHYKHMQDVRVVTEYDPEYKDIETYYEANYKGVLV